MSAATVENEAPLMQLPPAGEGPQVLLIREPGGSLIETPRPPQEQAHLGRGLPQRLIMLLYQISRNSRSLRSCYMIDQRRRGGLFANPSLLHASSTSCYVQTNPELMRESISLLIQTHVQYRLRRLAGTG